MKPTPGRIVHYVLREDESKWHAEHRPAIVVQCFGSEPTFPTNMTVFLDGWNDGGEKLLSKSSVPYSGDKTPGTWHWPEQE